MFGVLRRWTGRRTGVLIPEGAPDVLVRLDTPLEPGCQKTLATPPARVFCFSTPLASIHRSPPPPCTTTGGRNRERSDVRRRCRSDPCPVPLWSPLTLTP